MRRLIAQSPAIAISAVALLVALTGCAIAGTSATTAGPSPAQIRKIAASEIARLAPTLSVRSAKSANAPALYARISGAGVVTSGSGITQANVIHPRAGIYCFKGLRSAPKGGVAVLDALPPGASGPEQVQVGVGTLGACPAGTRAVVGTFKVEGGDLVDDPFFVLFWS
jgi:hypothetical protein